MRASRLAVGAVVAVCLVPGGLAGQRLSAAGHVGTLGLGADVSIGVGPRIAFRAGANIQPWEPSRVIEDIDFKLNLPSPSFVGAIDLYLVGPLRATAGVIAFGSDIEVTGNLTGNVEIGNSTYSPAEVGTLSGVFDTRDVAPWFALGLGKAAGPGMGFMLDLGVSLQGEPIVDLTASGPLAGNPAFQADLDREEQNIQDEAKVVKFYPILSIGLVFGF